MDSLTSADLNAIDGASNDLIYAVGAEGTVLTNSDGAWHIVDVPVETDLYDVWVGSANNIFAVGANGTILHYDGVSWSDTSVSSFVTLRSIWSDDEGHLMLAGDMGTVMEYTDGAWQLIPSSNSSTLAAGWGGQVLVHPGLDLKQTFLTVARGHGLAHYDGDEWDFLGVASGGYIQSIWGDCWNDLFAVGTDGLIVHFNGRTLSRQTSPTIHDLRALSGRYRTVALAVGDNGAAVFYNGSTWSSVSEDDLEINFRGVWMSKDHPAYVVGESGTVYHWSSR